jgi:hypothetical protein
VVETFMNVVNVWAVLVSAISAFALGGIWYSKAVFGNAWCREAGLKNMECGTGHQVRVFATAFFLSLVAATTFAALLGKTPPLQYALMTGFLVGFCFVATSFGINYLFANRSFKLYLIDAGYHLLQFMLYGMILGLWH